ncbi:MAG: class I SAM-dependent methyltransferase [Hyphomonadaceae bacterium]|nr:class I SAM-dependent methyltransferase [Hyphomonadaceae bacterium]
MSDRNARDWGNYWTGRTASEAGAALVGVGIETDTALAKVWARIFTDLPEQTRVLDLACGAGTALKAAEKAGLKDLTGVDIAADAIAALAREIPGAKGVVAPAGDTGLQAGCFDIVVSQFGFEYAGAEPAAKEAVRLLSPSGGFVAIAHLAEGGIARECEARLALLREIGKSRFIPLAQEMFRAVFAVSGMSDDSRAIANQKVAAFKPAADHLAGLVQSDGPNGLVAHLYSGTAQLFERLGAYALADIEGWLTGMQGEIDAYAGRMQSMLDAALDETGAQAVLNIFQTAGFQVQAPEAIDLGREGEPAAWLLKAGI